jgi:hypothetical protein
MRVEIGDEGSHLFSRHALREPLGLAHQSPVRPGTHRDMAQQTRVTSSQPRGPAGRRHRVLGALTDDDQMLEQAPHRGDAAVHRRRGRSPPAKRHHLLAARRPAGLPVQVVEQITRRDIAQPEGPIGQEPSEVRQIERVRPHRRRRERPHAQVIEEPVARSHHRTATDEAMATR